MSHTAVKLQVEYDSFLNVRAKNPKYFFISKSKVYRFDRKFIVSNEGKRLVGF